MVVHFTTRGAAKWLAAIFQPATDPDAGTD
jgi:hypothetical protein